MASLIMGAMGALRDWAVGPTTDGYSELHRTFEGEKFLEIIPLVQAQVDAAIAQLTAIQGQCREAISASDDTSRLAQMRDRYIDVRYSLQVAREAKVAGHIALTHFQTAVSLKIPDAVTDKLAKLDPSLRGPLNTLEDERIQSMFTKLSQSVEALHSQYDSFKKGGATTIRNATADLDQKVNPTTPYCNDHWHSIGLKGATNKKVSNAFANKTDHFTAEALRLVTGAMYYMKDDVTGTTNIQTKSALLELRERLVVHLSKNGGELPHWELVRYEECKEAAAAAKAKILQDAAKAATQESGEETKTE